MRNAVDAHPPTPKKRGVMKTKCPVCKNIYITKEHAERHADAEHKDWRIPKQRGWRTPYGFIDFGEPVTYEEALKASQKIHERFIQPRGGTK